jgi:hypothetical protein
MFTTFCIDVYGLFNSIEISDESERRGSQEKEEERDNALQTTTSKFLKIRKRKKKVRVTDHMTSNATQN